MFTKPVILLIGPKTVSAAEDFASSFQGMHRGELIGEPTAGSTGQPMFFKLPGGGSARICTIEEPNPDGSRFVGIGIMPKIIISPTVADIRAGRDPVLERAVQEAQIQ